MTAFVWTIVTGGLRPGEEAGLALERVDFMRREIHLDRQLTTITRDADETPEGETRTTTVLAPPKTESSVRRIPIADSLIAELNRHLSDHPPHEFEPGATLLFTNGKGEPLRRNTLGYTWDRLRTKLDLPPEPIQNAGRVYIHPNVISLAASYYNLETPQYRTHAALSASNMPPGVETPPLKISHNTIVEPGPIPGTATGGPYRRVVAPPVKCDEMPHRTQEAFSNIFAYTAPIARLGYSLAPTSLPNDQKLYARGHFVPDGNTYALSPGHAFFNYKQPRLARGLGIGRSRTRSAT